MKVDRKLSQLIMFISCGKITSLIIPYLSIMISLEIESTKETVLEQVKKEGVKFVEMQFSDIMGTVKSISIPSESLEEAMDEGVSIDGSSILGYSTVDESEFMGIPVLDSLQIYPWTCGTDQKTARLVCKIFHHDGNRFQGDPRLVLERATEKAKEMGFICNVGPEMEFFLLNQEEILNGIPRAYDKGRYFDLMPLDQGEKVRKEIVTHFNKMGFHIKASHHEVAPGQQEVILRHGDALSLADRVMTMKFGIRTIAKLNGLHATFMPKPFQDDNGNAMHVHQSLAHLNGENAFDDPEGEFGLSEIDLNYLGGLLAHAKETCAVLTSHVNSYRRLMPGYEAPCYIVWANRNRSALIRVPYLRGKGTRLEHRNPDPAGNPYLQFAVMLSAGLDGVRKSILPPEPVEKDVYSMSSEERTALGVNNLPENLGDALDQIEDSEFMKETLGDHIFQQYSSIKKMEWHEFKRQVTPWELERYIMSV
jgi:glutamine synthetase